MNDRDEVIRELQAEIDNAIYPDRPRRFMFPLWLAEKVLELLKEQEPRPLTLMEACGAEVCWIEKRVQQVITVCKVRLYSEDDYSAFINYMLPYANENIPTREYGKKWRCWNVRPTDAQRKAVKWDD